MAKHAGVKSLELIVLYEEKIKDLKERIKIYQESFSFDTDGSPKFHDDFDKEYTIACYRNKKTKGFYPRTSTITKNICPPYLQNWMKRKSEAAQDKIRDTRSVIGTVAHKLCEEYIKGIIGEDKVYLLIGEECLKYKLVQTREMKDAVGVILTSFMKIWNDRGFQYIASEVTIHSDILGDCGTLDIIAIDKDGDLHNIDNKTGRKSNGVVIEAAQNSYKFRFEEQFGLPIKNTIFSLDERKSYPLAFTYKHYDMGLRAYIGCMSIFQVDQWKQLKTFWPHWNKDFSNIKHRSWK